MKRKIALILSVLLLVSLLAACGETDHGLYGTWQCSWDYNGNHIDCEIVLNSDGTFIRTYYKNGSYSETETGTFDINGSSLETHENGNEGVVITYKITSDNLVNNGHKFVKK